MRLMRSVRVDELADLADAHPDQIGKWDPKKHELRTPNGEVIKVEPGRVGRSEKVFVTGPARDFLKGLDLPELRRESRAKGGIRMRFSLKRISPRQITAARSWGSWLKANPQVDPEAVCNAVRQGYAMAEEDIKKAREAAGNARKKAVEAATLRALRAAKRHLTAEQLSELLKKI